MPNLSIIIPCYNQSKFLSETLDSILNQPYQCWECILVDDGSTDDTDKIIEQYLKKDSRFKAFYQENKGPSAARNLGIKNSNGRFLHFLDSDDKVYSNIYVGMIDFLEKNKSIEILYGRTDYIDEFGKRLNKTHTLPGHIENYALKFLLGNFFPLHCAIIKRSLLSKIGLFYLNHEIEDLELWIRAAFNKAKFHQYNHIICSYRKYSGSRSTRHLVTIKNIEQMLKEYLSILTRTHDIPGNFDDLSYVQFYITYYLRANQHNDIEAKKYCYEKIDRLYPKCLFGITKYHYYILGKYLDFCESANGVYKYKYLPLYVLIFLRKIKRYK